MTKAEKAEALKEWPEEYESGYSIRQIARRVGRSYGVVRDILIEGGVTLRGRGGQKARDQKK